MGNISNILLEKKRLAEKDAELSYSKSLTAVVT